MQKTRSAYGSPYVLWLPSGKLGIAFNPGATCFLHYPRKQMPISNANARQKQRTTAKSQVSCTHLYIFYRRMLWLNVKTTMFFFVASLFFYLPDNTVWSRPQASHRESVFCPFPLSCKYSLTALTIPKLLDLSSADMSLLRDLFHHESLRKFSSEYTSCVKITVR